MTLAAAATLLALAAAPWLQDPEPQHLEPRDAEELRTLQPAIEAAIDKGIAWLLSTQQHDGSWSYENELFVSGQTALSTYTLLKCGLPPEHAAVQRGVAHLRTIRPTLVYPVACQLLALGETRDPSHHDHMRELARDLERWQNGSWDYPNADGAIGRLHNDRDLSLTQFALLGLRAAQKSGLSISRRALRDAFDATLRYQARGDRAGFRYHFARHGDSTGSMTTAGIGALMIAAECLDERLGRTERRALEDACTRGLAWLEANWSVRENPNKGKSWLYYYLYGLERIGALLRLEYVGSHPWYLEGARFLVDAQAADGSWSQDNAQPDTCFALLFLKRATAPTTGKTAHKAPIVETPESSAVGVTVRGGADGSRVQAWLTRLEGLSASDVTDQWPFVTRVRWLVDGDERERVELGREWRGAPCLVTLPFARRGTYRVEARVETATVEGDHVRPAATRSSTPVEVVVDQVLEDWMLDAATAHARNALLAARARVSASSTHEDHDAARAFDGNAATAWLFERDDSEPVLRVRLTKSVRAHKLWFAQSIGTRRREGQHDRIERISVTLDRNDPIELALHPDELAVTTLELPSSKRFRQLEIRVLARTPGKSSPGLGGFAEIGVE